jgi:hypothetical protein
MGLIEIFFYIFIVTFPFLVFRLYKWWTHKLKQQESDNILNEVAQFNDTHNQINSNNAISEENKEKEIPNNFEEHNIEEDFIENEEIESEKTEENKIIKYENEECEKTEISSKILLESNIMPEEIYEKEIQSKLSNLNDINNTIEIFKEDQVIAINKKETNEFLISHVMAKTTSKQIKESEEMKDKLSIKTQKSIEDKGGLHTYFENVVKFKEESIEFTMVALNECFKQNSYFQPIFQKDGFSDEIHKYYLNNLIYSGENKKDKVTIYFEDNNQYSFEEMKLNSQKSGEFIQKIEKIFYSKYPQSQGFNISISTIVKGSKGLVFGSNLSESQLNDFLNEVKQYKEFGAISYHSITPAMSDLKITADMFDSRGNIDFSYLGNHEKRGGMDYYQPKKWKRIGLKVSKLYDGGNDDWLAMNGNENEWAVAFHGTQVKYISGITQTNIAAGPNQRRENDLNRNPLNNSKYPRCGKGVYFGQCIEICDKNGYCPAFKVNGGKMKVAFQCRVNPREVRITTDFTTEGCGKTIIVPNSKPGCYDNIRPYGILLLIV